MMNKYLNIILFLTSITLGYSQGLVKITEEDKDLIDQFSPESFGFSEAIPNVHSLKKHVPPVRNQGETNACVGFAMGYYAISTMHNYYFNRTEALDKLIHGFDPFYAYSINIGSQDLGCSEEGLNMLTAFKRFSIFGAKKTFFNPIDVDCDKPIDSETIKSIDNYVTPYELESFEFIQTYNPRFVDNVKKSVANNYPVIIGSDVKESLYDVAKFSSGDAVWTPSDDEPVEGGHAMTVIGYDDYKNGGSFEIVNSWGSNWGNEGYFWISYDDFYKNITEAYVIKPYELDYENKGESSVSFNKNYLHFGENKKFIYEGEISDDGKLEGMGILRGISRNGNPYYSAGYFSQDKRQGKHLVLTPGGNYIVDFIKGEPQEVNELGFSSQQEDDEIQIQMDKMGIDFEIKKARRSELDSFFGDPVVGKWKIKKKNN